jgi:hypothetical protein
VRRRRQLADCFRSGACVVVWVVVVLVMLTEAATAQSPIRGVLFDSVRTSAPIESATVRLLGTGRTTTTDVQGRFVFLAPPAAATAVAFWAPWLDSLGLPALRASLPAAGADRSRSVLLATPSTATLYRQHCGGAPGPEEGVMLGEVRRADGAAVPSAAVSATWRELRIGTGVAVEQVRATVDTAGPSGRYALCGVPRGAVVSVQAAGRGVGTGVMDVPQEGAFHSLDLVVGAADDVLTVQGTVRSASGDPVRGAQVTLRDDTLRTTRTDSAGTFRIPQVPRRSLELAVRAVGYAPGAVLVTPPALGSAVVNSALELLPPELERVVVTATPAERDRLGFERRRRAGMGVFITDEMLARQVVVSANTISTFSARVRAIQSNNGRPTLMLTRGPYTCAPRWFLDGIDDGVLDKDRTPEQWDALRRAKRIEIYPATQAPPEFNDFNGCGSIVVWTR